MDPSNTSGTVKGSSSGSFVNSSVVSPASSSSPDLAGATTQASNNKTTENNVAPLEKQGERQEVASEGPKPSSSPTEQNDMKFAQQQQQQQQNINNNTNSNTNISKTNAVVSGPDCPTPSRMSTSSTSSPSLSSSSSTSSSNTGNNNNNNNNNTNASNLVTPSPSAPAAVVSSSSPDPAASTVRATPLTPQHATPGADLKNVKDLLNTTTTDSPKTSSSSSAASSLCNHNGGPGIGTTNHLENQGKFDYPRSSNQRQQIILEGSDRTNSFSVYSKEVDVITSRQSSNPDNQAGSNKVKTTTVVKFEWESRKYLGNLVAVHMNGIFVAYCLRGKSGANIRIINRKTADRTLLKDFCGRVTDLAFAFTEKILLAAIDEMGNLYIHQVTGAADGKIETKLLLNVTSYNDGQSSEFHRVFWCPYIPDESDDDTTPSQDDTYSKMLLITHGEKAEIWNVDIVCQTYGSDCVASNQVQQGVLRINSHTKPISDAAFSPDGSALATASKDGMVKFFQINMNDGPSPRRLHEWSPHGGQPLSCLFFLDDHQNPHPEVSFWKYAVTGAKNNQELKVWSCVSWTCLQTIRFLPPPAPPLEVQTEPYMKVVLDLSARYLVLTDFRRKVLYILSLNQDHKADTAHISSVSEFLLAQPCLSFAILDAHAKKFRQSLKDDTFLEELTTGEIEEDESEKLLDDEDGEIVDGVLIKLYAIHSSILQELHIRFKPESTIPESQLQSLTSVSQDNVVLRDGLSDVSNIMDTSVPDTNDTSRGETAPVLLTPDAFTSKPHSLQTNSANTSFTQVSTMDESCESPGIVASMATASAGSNSSSRGVVSNVTSVASSGVMAHTPSPSLSSTSSQSPHKNKDPAPLSSVSTISPVVPIDHASSSSAGPAPLPPPASAVTSLPLQTLFSEGKKISVEELFKMSHQAAAAAAAVSKSISSSVSSLEAETVFRKAGRKDFDETDKEVAEVMGDRHTTDEVNVAVSPLEIKSTKIKSDRVCTPKMSPREWPKPPDVSTEGPRIASEKVCNTREGQDVDDDDEDEDEDDDYRIGVGAQKGIVGLTADDEEEEEDDDDEDEQSQQVSRPLQLPVLGKAAKVNTPRNKNDHYSKTRGEPPFRETPVQTPEQPVQIIREVIEPQSLKDIQSNLKCLCSQLAQYELMSQQLHEQLLQQQLKQQTAMQQAAKLNVTLPILEQHLKSMENRIASNFERVMHQQSQREHQRYQDILNETHSREKKHEELVNTLWQAVDTTIRKNLDLSVKTEMKNHVLPAMMQSIESVKNELTREVAQKLTASDAILKDNLTKLIRNRQTIEAIGSSVGSSIEVPIQTAYRDAFQNIVIPNFERTSQNMYNQVHDTFQKGTKEYLLQLQQHLEVSRRRQLEVRDPVVGQLQSISEMFKSTTEHIHTHLMSSLQNKLESVVSQTMQGVKDSLLTHVRDVVRDEVSKAMKAQGNTISDNVLSAMRSGAVTPIPGTQDVQQLMQNQILRLLNQGQINAAFQQALSAANLEVVIHTCEKADPEQVFGQIPCPLQQPVLLSLIQQLSADIETHTLLKQKYLEEAIVSLDTSNPITHEHKRGVLNGLIPKLQNFIQSHPTSPDRRSICKLLMLSQSHLN